LKRPARAFGGLFVVVNVIGLRIGQREHGPAEAGMREAARGGTGAAIQLSPGSVSRALDTSYRRQGYPLARPAPLSGRPRLR
jgi:hypothetical protein